jgi:hypothetical protein
MKIIHANNFQGPKLMGLIKPPNILTFFIALAFVILAAAAKLGVGIPLVTGNEIWFMFLANVLFILGCITRGF